MKKAFKILIFILVLIIAYRFIYQEIKSPTIKIVETQSDAIPKNSQANAPASLKVEQTSLGKPVKINEQKLNDEEFNAFDKLEENWLFAVQEIIGDEKYSQYLEMREKNEKEKLDAYKEYHDSLRQKYGDKFSYNLSDDQSSKEKKINQKYLKDLLKLIGPENFKKYTAIKDQFNEEQRRKNKASIQIEF
ncbi:MAG: hypothetical protein Q7U04_06640 [Bacteriovorax sp.]|nr:hypothetical protein [Bacteriovorax sp.]